MCGPHTLVLSEWDVVWKSAWRRPAGCGSLDIDNRGRPATSEDRLHRYCVVRDQRKSVPMPNAENPHHKSAMDPRTDFMFELSLGRLRRKRKDHPPMRGQRLTIFPTSNAARCTAVVCRGYGRQTRRIPTHARTGCREIAGKHQQAKLHPHTIWCFPLLVGHQQFHEISATWPTQCASMIIPFPREHRARRKTSLRTAHTGGSTHRPTELCSCVACRQNMDKRPPQHVVDTTSTTLHDSCRNFRLYHLLGKTRRPEAVGVLQRYAGPKYWLSTTTNQRAWVSRPPHWE